MRGFFWDGKGKFRQRIVLENALMALGGVWVRVYKLIGSIRIHER